MGFNGFGWWLWMALDRVWVEFGWISMVGFVSKRPFLFFFPPNYMLFFFGMSSAVRLLGVENLPPKNVSRSMLHFDPFPDWMLSKHQADTNHRHDGCTLGLLVCSLGGLQTVCVRPKDSKGCWLHSWVANILNGVRHVSESRFQLRCMLQMLSSLPYRS